VRRNVGASEFANSIRPLHETLKKYCRRRLKAGADVSSSHLNKHRLINSLTANLDETCPCHINAQAVLPPKISRLLPGSLIDGPPKVMAFPLNRQEHFIHMPLVSGLRPPPERIRIGLAELPAPLPNRLVRHDDAPGEQELFRVAVAETKAEVQPDAMTDDFRWKSVILVGGGLGYS